MYDTDLDKQEIGEALIKLAPELTDVEHIRVMNFIEAEATKARIDESTKWLEIAETAKTEFSKNGLPLEMPIASVIKVANDRLAHLKTKL